MEPAELEEEDEEPEEEPDLPSIGDAMPFSSKGGCTGENRSKSQKKFRAKPGNRSRSLVRRMILTVMEPFLTTGMWRPNPLLASLFI